jgi:prolyl-tRNA synthetase
MAHGDDYGLCLPPKLAPIQVAIVLISPDSNIETTGTQLLQELEEAGCRVEMDSDTHTSYGRRVTGWELKGVPVRIEIGQRELDAGNVTIALRDTREKQSIPVASAVTATSEALSSMQDRMLLQARSFRDEHTYPAATLEDAAAKAIEGKGFATIPWSRVGNEGEKQLAEKGLTVRCLVAEDGSLPVGMDDNDLVAVIAKTY